jgi:hypothetical protein
LIDLCVLTDTLVIDGDGIYDPRQLNDRLLLGLKRMMSEFELRLLRQRAQEALRTPLHMDARAVLGIREPREHLPFSFPLAQTLQQMWATARKEARNRAK